MVCDEVIVLYQGRVVEQGAPATLFVRAAHPYTRALLQAVPRMRPGRVRERTATPPDAGAAGLAAAACAFAPRCAFRHARCLVEAPELRVLHGAHAAACHVAEQVAAQPGPATPLTQNA